MFSVSESVTSVFSAVSVILGDWVVIVTGERAITVGQRKPKSAMPLGQSKDRRGSGVTMPRSADIIRHKRMPPWKWRGRRG